MITTEAQELSMAELKARLTALHDTQRCEILEFLRELQAGREKSDEEGKPLVTVAGVPEVYVTVPDSSNPGVSLAVKRGETSWQEKNQPLAEPAGIPESSLSGQSRPAASLQEAKAYLYKNCDRLLQRLAQ